jgi:hypothetical protein
VDLEAEIYRLDRPEPLRRPQTRHKLDGIGLEYDPSL